MEQLNVKIGDKVLLSGGYPHNHYERICEVEKVTPTGRIRLKGYPDQFNKYGEKMSRKRWDAPCSISLLTDETEAELREKWRKQSAIRKAAEMCHKVKEEKLDYDLAVKIIGLLGDATA